MKLFILLFFIVGCGVNSSSNINIDANDIRIIRKGNLCFGVVASRRSGTISTTGLGLAHVPCDKI